MVHSAHASSCRVSQFLDTYHRFSLADIFNYLQKILLIIMRLVQKNSKKNHHATNPLKYHTVWSLDVCIPPTNPLCILTLQMSNTYQVLTSTHHHDHDHCTIYLEEVPTMLLGTKILSIFNSSITTTREYNEVY